MPSLREFLDFLADCAERHGETFSDEFAGELERQLQSRYPAERIYITPAGSRKDPARTERAISIARTAPTQVVAERLGISRRHARRICKKGTNPAA